MSYKYFSNIHRCNCPKKFQGEHCEIGMEILLYLEGGGGTRDLGTGRDELDARAGRG